MRLGVVCSHEDGNHPSLGHGRDPQLRKDSSQFVPNLQAPRDSRRCGVRTSKRVYAHFATDEKAGIPDTLIVVRGICRPAYSGHIAYTRSDLHLLIYAGRERQPTREYLLSWCKGRLASAVEGRWLHGKLDEGGPSSGHSSVRRNLVESVKLAVEGEVTRVLARILGLNRWHRNRQEQNDQQQYYLRLFHPPCLSTAFEHETGPFRLSKMVVYHGIVRWANLLRG